MSTGVAPSIDGAGMARVDFFLEHGTDKLFVNEVNTIPGSMAAYLWIDPPLSRAVLFDDMLSEAEATPTRVFSTAGSDGTALANAGSISSKLG
jgi:D-alanine-D-alanine ligase